MRPIQKKKILLGTALILLFIASLLHTLAASPPANQVGTPPKSLDDPLLTLKPITLAGSAREDKIKRLIKAIDVLTREGMIKHSLKIKRSIAEAALYAQSKTGVDAMLMIALARMESDFRGLVLINPACKFGRRTGGCWADCGMTQHHVRGSLRYVRSECMRAAKNPKYSFLKSAEEVALHINWCKTHPKYHRPLRRCVLNRYNQGPFYKTPKWCKRRFQCNDLGRVAGGSEEYHWNRIRKCRRDARKCRQHAAYWQQLSCFEYGARNGIRSRRTCRRCRSIAKIRTYFYPVPSKPFAATSFLFALLSR